MSEGSPLAALQRREAVNVVPALLIQPRQDQQHIYDDPSAQEPGTDFDKFIAAYRAAGGSLDVAMYDAPQYFTVNEPGSPAALDAFARMIAFFRKNIPEP